VRDETKVAEVSEEVVEGLRAKHPAGEARPFGPTVGPAPGTAVTAEEVSAGLDSFKRFTAAGISGWTVPMLRLAAQSPKVAEFLLVVTRMVGAGTCPGASMLCASRLTPLLKRDGGLRPIAVGELIYRLSTKVLLRHHFKADSLLPTQFGVGSKGGVEPITRLVSKATLGELRQPYTHLVSLDFSNAFNTVSRRQVAESLREYAPSLYRAAKWVNNDQTDLVIGDSLIKSASGVRQGDPLGPLLFSLAIRPLLTSLSAKLGEDRLVVAYLDDIYILSTNDTALAEAKAFLAANPTSLRLNEAKCTEVSFAAVAEDGVELLGTCVGSSRRREGFLSTKVDALISKLSTVADLPHQQALLLLRNCLQQDLRHLQRSLKTDDLVDPWRKLDGALREAVNRMRGRTSDRGGDRAELEKALIGLPARFGGLGLLSHENCSPHAYAAANEEADRLLEAILDVASPNLANDSEPRLTSQHERCEAMWKDRHSAIFADMDDAERKLAVENSSPLGRKWLSTIPYYQPLSLTDYEISTGLHYRLLSSSPSTTCSWCGRSNTLGHDELCRARPPTFVARHDSIARILHSALQTVDPSAEHEPHSFEGRRRNDIRLRGSAGLGHGWSIDFDIKVYSLLASNATRVTTSPPADCTALEHALAQSTRYLDRVGQTATRVRPLTSGNFKPLVLSTGGLLSKDTADEVRRWKRPMGEATFERMRMAVGLALVRARARTFGAATEVTARFGDLEE